MAKIINLRTARKQRIRSTARTQADMHAARHGQSKAEKDRIEAEQTRLEKRLDAHERDDPST